MKGLLVCPKCAFPLRRIEKTLKCDNGHCYDVAKQGYVNLLLSNSVNSGDDKEMCRSRHDFHLCDFYGCLSRKLSEICLDLNCKSIIDAGCGEGYYLRKIRDFYYEKGVEPVSLCGMDIAKEGIAIAARSEKSVIPERAIEYAVAGIFDMPISCESADCILSVFAPVPDSEAKRTLCKGGYLVVVSPGEKHLEGLKNAIYDKVYDNVVASKDYDGFEKYATYFAEDTITVGGDNIFNLFHMTPYYWKTSESDAKKLEVYSEITTKIEFVITIYKKI